MFKFDEDFLEEVGLTDMPEEQKTAFLEYAQDQFETRIGEKMSEGLNEAQLEEFGKIADNDPETVQRLLNEAGDYKNSSIYQALLNNGMEDGSIDTINNFVTATWLNKNCPNYVQILENVLNDLEEEIRSQKDMILANA